MLRMKYSIATLLCLLTSIGLSAQILLEEDFDNGVPGNWSIIDGGNTSQTWEHTQDYNGNTLDGTPFMFVDSDASQADHLVEELESPAINTNGNSDLVLAFDHHFSDQGPEEGFVEVWDGSSWVQVANYTDDKGGWTNPHEAEIDIANHQNANMKVRFRYDDDGVWGVYWAIDNVQIKNKQCFAPTDFEALQVHANSVYVNWESDYANSASWEVQFGPPGFSPGNGTSVNANNDTTAIGQLNANTEYDLYVRENCVNGEESDWTGPLSVRTRCNTQVLPYFEDMEGFNVNYNATGYDCWIPDPRNTNSSYRWNVDSGGTTSGSTGPSFDHTQGIGGNGTYAYTEATSGNQGDEALLSSSQIDLHNIQHPLMSFWYHMNGSEMGSLHVDVSTDGGDTWQNDVMQPIVGPQQGSENDPWRKAYVDLGTYNDQVILVRFRGILGTGFESDMAVDDIRIDEGPLKDLKAKGLVSPSEPDCYGVGQPVEIPIVNGGSDSIDFTQDSTTVTVEVTGVVNQTFSTTINDNSLNGGTALGTMDSIVVDMGNVNMAANGLYQFTGYIDSISGDTLPFNDTIVQDIQVNASSGGTVQGGGAICEGDSAPLIVNNSNGLIQWQMDSGNGWNNIPGATSPSYTASLLADTVYYRVEACGSATSNVDTVTKFEVTPPIAEDDTFCLGADGTASLSASGGGDFFWYEDSSSQDHVDTGASTQVGVNYVEKTMWVSRANFSTTSHLLITEIDNGAWSDGVEIQNVSQTTKDLSDHQLFFNDDPNIDDVDETYTFGSAVSLSSGDVVRVGENNSSITLTWTSSSDGWVILMDENDQILDMVFIGYGQSDIQNFSQSINGNTVTASGHWSGDGLTTGCDGFNGDTHTRIGSDDHNDASDWNCDTETMGSSNPGLNLPLDGCKSEKVAVTAYPEECVGIERFEEDIELSLYPNPVERDRFRIRMEGEQSVEGILSIRDLSGRVLRNERRTLEQGVNDFDTRGMSQGVYMLSFKSEGGNFHKKLVVK